MYFCVLCRIRAASYPFRHLAALAAVQEEARRRGRRCRACIE
ncbi:3-oxoadipate:succinyl-CoA transferase [Burkholderia ubonensis]|uniref:3-oxoadipate:succinyl-CoA transferase n=1 Tax=Burkholderia ubonensis TaxID=101571 RepID=A0AB74D266_9BURK|nr:3-oxoadipate:succinyl-CoA transferase [Burkholderia ubonensis]PAJ84872.1 3-oxoadipate:succinyl-CoA transferase [Burkholderia ubonensis]PAJ94334.1 3-oxoadipate:succinyl-CoA transferase [Burkholderia ubonensis]PAJ98577.1 3-oxoadipate:succinyl-CoA transferase [Burkholderia ubonensis]PAK10009.1 3-oxoadipate:succinyl-CoA transferase [Burkholderia ubonensis]